MFTITYHVGDDSLVHRKDFDLLADARDYFDWIAAHPAVHTVMFFDNNCELVEVL